MATTERILDVGCGRDKLPGAIGIDSNPRSDADIVHDIDQRPWPIESDSITRVRAQDVLEHVADFFGVMSEIHRVCVDGAIVDVRMPFMSSLNFATDPTHRRAGTSGTFDYFDPSRPLGNYRYTDARFDLIEFRYGRFYHGLPGAFFKLIDRLLLPYFERKSAIYEHYFAYIYPVHEISYRLRVRKTT